MMTIQFEGMKRNVLKTFKVNDNNALYRATDLSVSPACCRMWPSSPGSSWPPWPPGPPPPPGPCTPPPRTRSNTGSGPAPGGGGRSWPRSPGSPVSPASSWWRRVLSLIMLTSSPTESWCQWVWMMRMVGGAGESTAVTVTPLWGPEHNASAVRTIKYINVMCH